MPTPKDKSEKDSHDKVDKGDIYQDINEEINKYGLSPSSKIYDKISEDPQGLFSNYYNALRRRKEGENTPEIREFLSNINTKFSKDFGFVYDPTTKESLHPILKDDPKFSQIENYSKNFYGNSDPINNIDSNIQTTKSTSQPHYGDASYGVGNENSPEYTWWKRSKNADISMLKRDYPEYKNLLDAYPPPESIKGGSGSYTRKLSKVISGYDPSTTKNTDEGVVFKDPGWNFYKVYDDGTREPIDESSYKTMKQFNNLPQHIKNKYVEEIDPSTLEGENKKIADQKMSVLKNK